ncbi:hypothetical protein M3231_18530 [Neobacillus mesonae]|nr:hypothetical protein [Neobacillus mesonae]
MTGQGLSTRALAVQKDWSIQSHTVHDDYHEYVFVRNKDGVTKTIKVQKENAVKRGHEDSPELSAWNTLALEDLFIPLDAESNS